MAQMECITIDLMHNDENPFIEPYCEKDAPAMDTMTKTMSKKKLKGIDISTQYIDIEIMKGVKLDLIKINSTLR